MMNPNKPNSNNSDNKGPNQDNKNSNQLPKKLSDIERTERVLAGLTSNPETFKGEVYPDRDVELDLELLEIFKNSPNYRHTHERSDAKLLEKTFNDLVERDDWFSEWDLYGRDANFKPIITVPTSEIDDVFNHIDLIGVIRNASTNGQATPFAIDITYNTDSDKIKKKFSWKHVYAKSANAPADASEFGTVVETKDHAGHNIKTTGSLKMHDRFGTRLPGFVSAKYFEDRNKSEKPVYPKGRINVMPRLVVGYDPEIADVLAHGMPSAEMQEKYGKQYHDKRVKDFQVAALRAKWCTLFECAKQASEINQMVQNLTEENTKHMYYKDLKAVKETAASIDTYFNKSLDYAIEQTKNDSDELDAMNYAKKDQVQFAISYQSEETYINSRTPRSSQVA